MKSNNYSLVHVRRCLPSATPALIASVFAVCLRAQSAISAGPTFTVPEANLSSHPSFVIYGDTRFTNWQPAKNASSPWAREALVQEIASEDPDALFVTGDIPFRLPLTSPTTKSSNLKTKAWAAAHLRVFPVLGNHEFYRARFHPERAARPR